MKKNFKQDLFYVSDFFAFCCFLPTKSEISCMNYYSRKRGAFLHNNNASLLSCTQQSFNEYSMFDEYLCSISVMKMIDTLSNLSVPGLFSHLLMTTKKRRYKHINSVMKNVMRVKVVMETEKKRGKCVFFFKRQQK